MIHDIRKLKQLSHFFSVAPTGCNVSLTLVPGQVKDSERTSLGKVPEFYKARSCADDGRRMWLWQTPVWSTHSQHANTSRTTNAASKQLWCVWYFCAFSTI